MKISNAVLEILKQSEILSDQNVLRLPQQLDRSLYVETNKTLEYLGGKWSRKMKGHLFEFDPGDAVELAVMTGEVVDAKKEFQFFETPEPVVKRMIELAEIKNGMHVLEPSAGKGAILSWLINNFPDNRTYFCEIQKRNCEFIKSNIGDEAIHLGHDFTSEKPAVIFDRVVMNPPFTRGQDIAHIQHAYKFLKPGGILVSITALGWTFRQDAKHSAFRNVIESSGAEVFDLPAGTFKDSGTMIATKLIRIRKYAVGGIVGNKEGVLIGANRI